LNVFDSHSQLFDVTEEIIMKLLKGNLLLAAFVTAATTAFLISVCFAYDLTQNYDSSVTSTSAIDSTEWTTFYAHSSGTTFAASTFTINDTHIVAADGGDITFQGNVTIESGGSLRVKNAHTITINGVLTVNSGGNVYVSDSGETGGTLDLTGSSKSHSVAGTIRLYGGNGTSVLKIGSGSTFTVSGTFRNTGGSNEDSDYSLITRSGTSGSYTVTLSGTVNVRFMRFSYLTDPGVTLNPATLTEFNYITFDNFQSLTTTDTYLYLGSNTNGATLYGMRFAGTTEPEYAVEAKMPGPAFTVTLKAFARFGDAYYSDYIYGDGYDQNDSPNGTPDRTLDYQDDNSRGNVKWHYEPTAVTLRSFTAKGYDSEVLIEWETAAEFENIGYNVYRSESAAGALTKINDKLISGIGTSALGGRYCFLDREVTNGKTYYYVLEDIDSRGRATRRGPVSAVPTEAAGRCDFDSSDYTAWATSSGEYHNATTAEPATDPESPGSVLLYNGPANAIYSGSENANRDWSVVEQTENSILIRIKIPEPVFGKKLVEGEVYDTVSIPGYAMISEVRRPELPSKGFLIALPRESYAAFSTLVDSVCEERSGITLYISPADRTSPLLPDIEISGREVLVGAVHLKSARKTASPANVWEEYPETVCSVGEVLQIAGKKFILLNVRPVVYNRAQHKIRDYSEMTIRVTFASATSGGFGKVKRGKVFSTQWDLAASEGLKIKVKEDGIYRISAAELLAAGFDASCDPRKLKLFEGGKQVAITVIGESDGRLDPEDYILFYGRKRATIYSDENTYWLVAGAGKSLRMPSLNVSVPQSMRSPAASSYEATRHFEENHIYWSNVPREGGDHWFWRALIAPDTKNFNFNLHRIANYSGNASLTISLQGATESGEVSPDHVVRVSINGTLVKETTFDGITSHTEVIQFPQSLLSEGSNTLTLELPTLQGVVANVVALNYFEIAYQRNFTTEEDTLAFPAQSNRRYRVDGFTSGDILLFDVTSPLCPVRLTNFTRDGSETFTILFRIHGQSGKRNLLALSEQKLLSPVYIQKDEASNLHSASNAADYIIITNNDFVQEAQILASHRQAQGLRTFVARIEDIYDEFNYGNPDAQAIRNFVRRAFQSWQSPAPKYILLLGDGTYDYKNYLGLGNRNFVPAYLAQTPYMETASDNYYVCVSGEDNLPDLFIGRLPASSKEEAQIMVNKIMDYENSAGGGSWLKKALFVTDNDEPLFSAIADELSNEMSADYTSEKIYLSQLGIDQTREKAIGNLNSGALIATYVGHGSVDIWAGEPILSSSDVDSLSNQGKLPFVLALTCLNGYFVYPYRETIAEEFLRCSGGGAIAYWGPTGLSTPDRQKLLGMNLFGSIFKSGRRCLGEITTEAKLLLAGDTEFSNIVDTWTLFGDPATRLK
jgi:hypothetical protein